MLKLLAFSNSLILEKNYYFIYVFSCLSSGREDPTVFNLVCIATQNCRI